MSDHAIVGLCTLELHLPGAESLKDKRRVLKSMMSRMRNTFNVATAEITYQDSWQVAVIAFVTVSNSTQHVNQVIDRVMKWIEMQYPDALIAAEEIEIL